MNPDVQELIEILESALQRSPRQQYRVLRFVLNRLVDIALREVAIQFSGLFAKISYLLHAHKAEPQMVRAIGGTRNRIRRQEEYQDAELAKWFAYDLKSVISLLQLLYPRNPIPEALLTLLPAGTLDSSWDKADIKYQRVVVERWDGKYIYAIAQDGDAPDVVVDYSSDNKYLVADYSYLTPLLKENCQLNIIRPRQREDGVLLPEIIIYEPDYLVDISSIAASFKEYGITPLTNLIRKISPSTSTVATLLGDFASQLLDEELHGAREYADSIKDFCRHRAVAMATCEGLDQRFHSDALHQKKNIHKAISIDMKNLVGDFDEEKALLEPSFTSEMLGIQGRMDFLQSDYRILVEQKSGKAKYVFGQKGFVNPTLDTPHYVQLLLYRSLLHYNYNIPNDQIRPLLLYSKYENPLVQTDSAPQLLQQAFMLRNQLVWLELKLGEDGFSLLTRLTPDSFNKNNVQSRLWRDYTAPDIASVLDPIRNASSLERAYCLRMLKFVQRENILSKIGNKRKENSGFAARWHDSLAEKKEAGNIVDALMAEPFMQGNAIEKVIMHRTDVEWGDNDSSNFRLGDVVIIYPYRIGMEPDCRKTIVHKASIEAINIDTIELRLRATQTNLHAFDTPDGSVWAMEHDFMESSYGSLYRGVHAFLSSPQSRRDMLMCLRHPAVDATRKLMGEYGSFDDLSLCVKQAQELYLIIGPPGTGKTSFGMLNTLKEELLELDSSVAVMAFTNRAVDEICSKLVEEGIDFVRIGSELNCDEHYRPYLLERKIEDIRKIDDIRDYIVKARVFVGTTTAFNSRLSLFSIRGFSLAIIDEASQILEPQLLGLLSATHEGKTGIRKVVMIGDHKQLPAVVQQTVEESAVDDPLLLANGIVNCRMSLFERLLYHYRDDKSVVYMLHRQGRMHAEIADFPNKAFYGGLLECVPLPHQIETSSQSRVRFIDVPASDDELSDKVNIAEAQVIADIVIDIYLDDVERFEPSQTVGIIVPYRNQISAVRRAIIQRAEASGVPSTLVASVAIDTVERFQGSQRDVIIYGFTVKRPYQLDFLTDNCFEEDGVVIDRKLNVVMTRAMKQLFLIGNAGLLCRNPLFARLCAK